MWRRKPYILENFRKKKKFWAPKIVCNRNLPCLSENCQFLPAYFFNPRCRCLIICCRLQLSFLQHVVPATKQTDLWEISHVDVVCGLLSARRHSRQTERQRAASWRVVPHKASSQHPWRVHLSQPQPSLDTTSVQTAETTDGTGRAAPVVPLISRTVTWLWRPQVLT